MASGQHDTHSKAQPEKQAAIREKVSKLLRQAADREGTAEGEAFREKAFALMAEYGVEQSQLRTESPQHVMREAVEFHGTYTDMQSQLLNEITAVLHCSVVIFRAPRSTKVERAVVFGRRHHAERAILLFNLLNLHMISGATRAVAQAQEESKLNAGKMKQRLRGLPGIRDMHLGFLDQPTASPQTQKRSWMRGFIISIRDRLRSIESTNAEKFVHGDTVGLPALRQDKAVAQDAMQAEFPSLRRIRSSTKTTFDAGSYAAGADAGRRMDLGQRRFTTGPREICR